MSKQKPVIQKTPPKKQPADVSSPSARPASLKMWWGWAAAMLAFALYANTLSHDYCLDDFSVIKDNLIVKGGLKNLGQIFSTEYRSGSSNNAPGSLYRPLSLAMFAAEWGLQPDQPKLPHLTNVLLYSLTGLLLFATLRRVLGGWPTAVAGITTLVFIAHPAHSEVVANIKSRDEILMFLGCIGAIYCLWRSFSGKNSWLGAALASYAGALFSKESAITFLAVIPLAMWFFTDKTARQIFSKTGLFLIPAGIFLLVRASVLGGQTAKAGVSLLDNPIYATSNLLEQKATAFMLGFQYLKTLIFPMRLVSDIGYPQMRPVGFGDWQALLGLVLVLGLVGLAVWGFKKKNPFAFASLYFLATFSVFSNILFLIGTGYGERLLYAPSLGFALAVSFGLFNWFKINELNQKSTLLFGIAGAIIVVFGLRTIIRNPAWKDSFSLYEADIKQMPNSAKLHYAGGFEFVKKGMNEAGQVADSTRILKGIGLFSKAISLWPDYQQAYKERGLAYFQLKKYGQGQPDLLAALKYDPNDAKVLAYLGFYYSSKGNLAEAEANYRKAIQSDPRFVDGWLNLGIALSGQKRYAEAISAWQEALKVIPSNDRMGRGRRATLNHYIWICYKELGDTARGEPFYQAAAAIDPTLPR